MPTKLSPEEKAARAAEKKEQKLLAKIAAKAAEAEARKKAWEEKIQKDREAFFASMSKEDREDFDQAIQQPSSSSHPVSGEEVVTNEFLHSLKTQFKNRGYLSDRQVEVLLRGFRTRRDLEKKSEGWKEIKEGDEVRMLCKIKAVENYTDSFGSGFKIRMMSNYGRMFTFKTGKEDWATEAEDAMKSDKWISVVGKVKWVAPNKGGVVVLTSRGMKFGRLIK